MFANPQHAPPIPAPLARLRQGIGQDFEGARVRYQPGNLLGVPINAPGRNQELVGHELAHVVQQRAGRVQVPQA
jgi:Domain of unknown function (DUF4157)